MKRACAALLVAIALAATAAPRIADTLPSQYTDAEFWKLVTDFSEPGGQFPYENFVSNEISYQDVIPEVNRRTTPGGVYLGVAAEQNFTYIAAIKPKVAFIFDIRRQNLVELLMYKALFEMSPSRSEFISRLFSRKLAGVIPTTASATALFNTSQKVRPDPQLYQETLRAMKDRLMRQHQFQLTADDQRKIEYIFKVFYDGGPSMDYTYASAAPNNQMPGFSLLLTRTDSRGENSSFLASEDRYLYIRGLQQKNVIIPVVGDFSGPKALKAAGKYLKDHKAAVTVFYVSNVEDYLQSSWYAYRSNIQALPFEESALFIRFMPRAVTVLRRIQDLPANWPGRSW